ncbi:MAG: hypothetical protein BSR46_04245 [Candidatus Dactylopiibacterium carminicum]|nr:MAG: hypothetical protein BSR46_04245 [Candidatus Dactylopiibacterium carminicum]
MLPSDRPQLPPHEAEHFTSAAYFRLAGSFASPDTEPWLPQILEPHTVADHLVGAGHHASVQAAVNAAIASGRRERQTIHVLPGEYRGAVYIPAGTPPLSIIGLGQQRGEVRLCLDLVATVSIGEYRARVNADGRFQPGDPAWAMYQSQADRPEGDALGTFGTATVWSQATDLVIANLSLCNDFPPAPEARQAQAVALRVDGDRTQLLGLDLDSLHDTLFLNARERIVRVLARDCRIAGDVDFLFGAASAVFEQCEFLMRSARRPTGIVFAPSTPASHPWGFLAQDCRFRCDAGVTPDGASLGRAWDEGAREGYRPGITANGQLLIRESFIDAHFRREAPWAPAATSARPFRGCDTLAQVDADPHCNRLWEYANHGPGAA